MRTHMFKVALSVVLLSACASAGGGSGGGSSDFISNEEIQAQGTQSEDAYALVQRLHPNWLRARGSAGLSGDRLMPVVFLNGSRYGDLQRLHDFRIGDIESLQYISGQNATTRYGTDTGGGIIMVTTRGQ